MTKMETRPLPADSLSGTSHGSFYSYECGSISADWTETWGRVVEEFGLPDWQAPAVPAGSHRHSIAAADDSI